VPELDLDRIKGAVEAMEDDSITDTVWTQRAVRLAAQVPRLIAEIERLQRLTGDAPSPSTDAYESAMQALADQQAVSARLRDLLGEVLKHFPDRPPRDVATVRSEAVLNVSLARWRSALGGES